MITPSDTDYLIRIHIREKIGPNSAEAESDMNWCLYTNEANLT